MRVSSSAPARAVSAYPKDAKVLGWHQGPEGLSDGGYIVQVTGNCMEPLILDGEKVAVEPSRPNPGDIVCIISRGPEQSLIKRLRWGFVDIIPLNPASEVSPIICVEQINPAVTYHVDGAKLAAIHRVSWVLRKDEWLSVDSLAASLIEVGAHHG